MKKVLVVLALISSSMGLAAKERDLAVKNDTGITMKVYDESKADHIKIKAGETKDIRVSQESIPVGWQGPSLSFTIIFYYVPKDATKVIFTRGKFGPYPYKSAYDSSNKLLR